MACMRKEGDPDVGDVFFKRDELQMRLDATPSKLQNASSVLDCGV